MKLELRRVVDRLSKIPFRILSLRHHLLATPISASFIILPIPLRIHLSVIQIERHKGSKAASRVRGQPIDKHRFFLIQ